MCHDLVRHLVDRLLLDHLAAGGAVRRAHARVEQAQVVVDLCDGGDCGAGIFGGGLLVDGDGGREAVDAVEVWLFHLAEELARVAGEALHIAALAFCVDGVEGERALARTRKAGENHQLVTGDLEVDVLEVVLASALDEYVLGSHAAPSSNSRAISENCTADSSKHLFALQDERRDSGDGGDSPQVQSRPHRSSQSQRGFAECVQ